MKKALDVNNTIIDIEEYIKSSSLMNCLCCNSEVIAKMGKIKIHHFAHKSKFDCSYSELEKFRHTNSMSEFHKNFQQSFKNFGAELEVIVKNNKTWNIADVVYNNRVYEIQHSPIKIKDVEKRNKSYKNQFNKSVIWILDGTTQHINNFDKNENPIVIVNNSDFYLYWQNYTLNFNYVDYIDIIKIITNHEYIKNLCEKKNEEEKERIENERLWGIEEERKFQEKKKEIEKRNEEIEKKKQEGQKWHNTMNEKVDEFYELYINLEKSDWTIQSKESFSNTLTGNFKLCKFIINKNLFLSNKKLGNSNHYYYKKLERLYSCINIWKYI